MCEHFKWPHDFWRRMSWQEFQDWRQSMIRGLQGEQPDPDRWQPSDRERFAQMRREATEAGF